MVLCRKEKGLKVAIIGAEGFVGKQAYNLFSKHYDTMKYDPYHGHNSTEGVNKCDLAVVCVPTNANDDGTCDTSIVEEVVSWIESPLILIKSAIAPGTVDRLKTKYKKRIVVSPEFSGESKYDNTHEYFHTCMTKTPWVVLGGCCKDVDEVYNIMLPIVGPEKRWYFLKAIEAELVKYFENIYFASKVMIAQEFSEVCDVFGADWKSVREAWLADTRIEPMHTAVFKRKPGAGGKCYPKDLSALIRECHINGYDPTIMSAVREKNVSVLEGSSTNVETRCHCD